MKMTFFSESFGCRVNEAERLEINFQLKKAGFEYDFDNPTFYIINTCAVTHKAEREVRQRLYQIKRKFPKTKLVITGCAATFWQKNQLTKNLPVDLIIENVNKEFFVEIVKNSLLHQSPYDLPGQKESLATSQKSVILSKFLQSRRLLVKIQDGCHRFCTFCIVPYLRGIPKSLTINQIIEKIKNFQGKISEVILTAVNTEAFGLDTGEKFIDLLISLIDQTNIARISLGSIHPNSIDDNFCQFYKQYLPKRRLVDFFHIPIQSGSDKILSLMKRGYRSVEILEKIHLIKNLNQWALIGTDVIVGFLDEEEADFEKTYHFLTQAPINKFHIFRYSPRKKTAAFYLAKRLKEPDDVIKKKRAKLLADLGQKKYEQFLQKHIGKFFSCLLLDKKDDQLREGLLSNQIPVFVKENKTSAGEIKNVKIIEFKKGTLFGKIV